MNQFLFEHVNIREQCSWVVEDRAAATAKAERLIRAAVSRIRHLVPLEMRRIPVHDTALVIGGGIAGLVSTRDLAQRGMKVLLVERTPFLGGRMAQLGKLFPTTTTARELLNKLIEDTRQPARDDLHRCGNRRLAGRGRRLPRHAAPDSARRDRAAGQPGERDRRLPR